MSQSLETNKLVCSTGSKKLHQIVEETYRTAIYKAVLEVRQINRAYHVLPQAKLNLTMLELHPKLPSAQFILCMKVTNIEEQFEIIVCFLCARGRNTFTLENWSSQFHSLLCGAT